MATDTGKGAPMSTGLTYPVSVCPCGALRFLYGQGIEHAGRRIVVEEPERLAIAPAIPAVWVCVRCDSAPAIEGHRGILSAGHVTEACDCRERQSAERAAAERRREQA